MDRQGEGLLRQLRTCFTAAGDCGAEDPSQGDSQHGRRRVGAVVDVLGEAEGGPPAWIGAGPPTDEGDRVHLEQQGGCAAFLGGLGVEDVGRSDGEVERLHLAGVLVQQEAEVRRGRGGRGHGEQHGADPSTTAGRQGHAIRRRSSESSPVVGAWRGRLRDPEAVRLRPERRQLPRANHEPMRGLGGCCCDFAASPTKANARPTGIDASRWDTG